MVTIKADNPAEQHLADACAQVLNEPTAAEFIRQETDRLTADALAGRLVFQGIAPSQPRYFVGIDSATGRPEDFVREYPLTPAFVASWATRYGPARDSFGARIHDSKIELNRYEFCAGTECAVCKAHNELRPADYRSEWGPAEPPPADGRDVLVLFKSGGQRVWYCDLEWETDFATHWRDLPDPPRNK